MAGPKGYSSYRGKIQKGKILLVAFLILLILASAVVILMQKYVVYDDSGHPRMELPQFHQEQSAAGSGKETNVPELTIQEPERTELRALTLPVAPLADWGAALQQIYLSAVACNAVVYTVKDLKGGVYIDSAAAPPEARRAETGTTAAVAAMTGSDIYAIARIHCFRDPVASSGDLDGRGLKNTGGYVFYDGNSDRWLDPAKPAARQYLIDLAKECVALGFDEILLADVSYPIDGKLNKIDYGDSGESAALQANLVQFLTELKAALAGTGVKLSLELPVQLLLNSASEVYAFSGQTLAGMAPLTDRICADVNGSRQMAESLSAAVSSASKTTAFLPEWDPESGGMEYLDLRPMTLPAA